MSVGNAALDQRLLMLRMTGKQLARDSVKASKESMREALKVKKALVEQKADQARMHAEATIRLRNHSTVLLRLSSRVEGMHGRLTTVLRMNYVATQLGHLSRTLVGILTPERMASTAADVEQMTDLMETLDAQCDLLEGVMGGATASQTPSHEVNDLIQQVADASELDVKFMMPETGGGAGASLPAVSQSMREALTEGGCAPVRKRRLARVEFGPGVLAEEDDEQDRGNEGHGGAAAAVSHDIPTDDEIAARLARLRE